MRWTLSQIVEMVATALWGVRVGRIVTDVLAGRKDMEAAADALQRVPGFEKLSREEAIQQLRSACALTVRVVGVVLQLLA